MSNSAEVFCWLSNAIFETEGFLAAPSSPLHAIVAVVVAIGAKGDACGSALSKSPDPCIVSFQSLLSLSRARALSIDNPDSSLGKILGAAAHNDYGMKWLEVEAYY